jgi:hypothetical protein
MRARLLVILIGLVVNNVEEAELIHALGGRNDTEPVTELLLLEELLGANYSLVSLPKFSFRHAYVGRTDT